VRDYLRPRRQARREVFVPLAHPLDHAQADFGEAVAVLGGVEKKIRFFVMDLPQSDAIFVKAYHAETAEAFCDGHLAAFAFFGGVPLSILYDNTTLAVAQSLGDGTRKRSALFAGLQSHYLFTDRFGRPAKGTETDEVEKPITQHAARAEESYTGEKRRRPDQTAGGVRVAAHAG
jgi:transposase